MKEKLIEIFHKYMDMEWEECASDIEELYRDYYPKEFVEWLSYGSYPFVPWLDKEGHFYTDEFSDKRWSIDELYEHWKTIKDK